MAVKQKKEANNTFVWVCNKDPFANFNASSPYTIQCGNNGNARMLYILPLMDAHIFLKKQAF